MTELLRTLVILPMPMLLLGLAGLLLWRSRRWSRGLLAAAVGSLLVASIPVVGELVLLPLRASVVDWTAADAPRTAAILVPTGGLYEDGLGGWWPHSSSVRRLSLALGLRTALAAAGLVVPIVVSGGVTEPDGPPEAEVVARRLGLTGDPGIIIEAEAMDSAATARIVGPMLRARGGGVIAIVSDRYHVGRMAALMRHEGLDPRAVVVRRRATSLSWTDFLPQPRGLGRTNDALWNEIGLLHYLLTGRLGLADLWAVTAAD